MNDTAPDGWVAATLARLDEANTPPWHDATSERTGTMIATFTPEAVRSALIAAGYLEHRSGEVEGFFIGDGRESRGEILVEPRREFYGTGSAPDWTVRDRARHGALLAGYREALAGTGYIAGIESRMVIVTEDR